MNREFKFKALMFNNETGKKTWIYYGISGKPFLVGNFSWIVEDLQFTGLKDVNNIDIYENDIIRLKRSYNSGFLPKNSVTLITWSSTELCFYIHGGRLTANKKVEVIGNKYENPDLLK